MGFYNVVAPCVVGKLHYARPTTAPIEVDDEVAAPLVEAGSLDPYAPGDIPVKPFQADVTPAHPYPVGPYVGLGDLVDENLRFVNPAGDQVDPGKPAPRPRGRRKPTED